MNSMQHLVPINMSFLIDNNEYVYVDYLSYTFN